MTSMKEITGHASNVAEKYQIISNKQRINISSIMQGNARINKLDYVMPKNIKIPELFEEKPQKL